MVNEIASAQTALPVTAVHPERALALSYAPVPTRPGLEALFALDTALGTILKTTREPIVGQMRLTWWYEALGRLDAAPPPAEPVLQALAHHVVPQVAGTTIATIAEGWEALLETPLDDAAVERFARLRGGQLFAAAASLLAVSDDRIAAAGEGWALADLSLRLSDPQRAAAVAAMARGRLDTALTGRWPRRARSLGALALLARADLTAPEHPAGSPKRVGRLLLHRLVGY
jgi:phytoene synthase